VGGRHRREPAYVTGEGEPYRPETLFWMSAEGAVLGHTVGKPGELVELACESLRSTIEQSMFGRPHAPDRVRVASPELAETLRAGEPDLEVVCAPTPEIDAVFAAMRERMNDDAETEQSYLSPDVGPGAIAAFFRAAAALFRATSSRQPGLGAQVHCSGRKREPSKLAFFFWYPSTHITRPPRASRDPFSHRPPSGRSLRARCTWTRSMSWSA
jgi:hypothetical protein